MFDRFTDRARKVLKLARQEAERLNHDYIGTEHILLGLAAEGAGIAANVLESLGTDLDATRRAVREVVPYTSDAVVEGQVPLIKDAHDVLDQARREAILLGNGYVGTEHLLLAITAMKASAAGRALDRIGLSPNTIRRELLSWLQPANDLPNAVPASGSGDVKSGAYWPPQGLTDPARKACELAREESLRLGHECIGTGHLLLGLLGEPSGLARKALAAVGLDPASVRQEFEKLLPRDPVGDRSRPLQLTPRAIESLRRARREAADPERPPCTECLFWERTHTGHLLLGLIDDADSLAYQVLVGLGAQTDQLRLRLRELTTREHDELNRSSNDATSAPHFIGPPRMEEPAWDDFEWAEQHTTDQASRAIGHAMREADRLQSKGTEAEHLLLGLLVEGKGVAAEVLWALGVDLSNARAATEKRLGLRPDGERPLVASRQFTDSMRAALDLAKSAAQERHHSHLGTEHLLLALLDMHGTACEILAALGVDPDQARTRLIETLSREGL